MLGPEATERKEKREMCYSQTQRSTKTKATVDIETWLIKQVRQALLQNKPCWSNQNLKGFILNMNRYIKESVTGLCVLYTIIRPDNQSKVLRFVFLMIMVSKGCCSLSIFCFVQTSQKCNLELAEIQYYLKFLNKFLNKRSELVFLKALKHEEQGLLISH